MICPHCGRNTNAADICQHCHKPTEFTTRFNSRPGAIPGLDDRQVPSPDPVKPPKKGRRILLCVALLCIVMSTLACALSIICLLQIGRLSRKEELPPVSVPETTSMPMVDCVVTFDWNQQDVLYQIPPISIGGILPTLQDIEGYRFTGWNTDPNGNGTSFHHGKIFDLELKQDLTLFAQWEPVPEQTEPTVPETEAANAAPDISLPDAFGSDIQDGSTSALTPNPPPTQDSEEYHG